VTATHVWDPGVSEAVALPFAIVLRDSAFVGQNTLSTRVGDSASWRMR
jgi:hypothetical protein